MYWLWKAESEGHEPAEVIEAALKGSGAAGTERAKLLKESLLRNLDILGKLGCLDAAGVAKLRTGNAPTVTKGPYAGELATVDHIVPRSVAPELDNLVATNRLTGHSPGFFSVCTLPPN